MELCLLLLVVMAVGVASTGTTTTSDTSSGSSGGGGGGGLFPSLQCGPASRRGRRLTGRPRPVQPPSTCQGPGGGRGAALCDQPGDDYPWEAIDNYLRQSSDFVKKRVENTLKASRIPAFNSARRRKARSTDDVTKNTDDVTKDEVFASNASDKIRAKKHIDPPPGNLEGSGSKAENADTNLTSTGDNLNLTFPDDSIEGSGDDVTFDVDTKETKDHSLNVLVSFFLNDEYVDEMTKDALKDMLMFRKTFVTPSGRDELLVPPTPTADGLTLTPTPTPTPTPTQTVDGPIPSTTTTPTLAEETLTTTPTPIPTLAEEAPSTDSDIALTTTSEGQTTNTSPDETDTSLPAKRPKSDVTPVATTRFTPTYAPDESPDEWDDLVTSASEDHPVATMPEALPLIASPPTIVHFNPPSSVTVRQRVTVAKTTPARPTTFGPELDDFTELIYASDAQRQPAEVEVAPPTVRTTVAPPSTTQDPYTESACDYWDEIRSPFYAMNTHNEWKTLINMPNYETYIHMEHCMEERSQGRCAPGCRCTQRYTVRNMPVYDRDSNGCDVIYMDEFLFPSHCDCQCLPPGHALLRPGTEAPATTPVPTREGDGYPASPPEGWLPARPTTGRIGQTGEGNGKGEGEKEGEEKVVIEVVEEKRDREGDLVLDEVKVEDREGGVETVTITEVVEAEKSDDRAVPSIGSSEKLKSTSSPPATGATEPGSGQHEGETANRATPTRPPPPAAILHHVTVRPRPRRPTAGPQLPPGVRWGASARRDPQEASSSHRNRHRGPPEPRAEVTRR